MVLIVALWQRSASTVTGALGKKIVSLLKVK